MLLDVLTVVVLGWFGSRLVVSARRTLRRDYLRATLQLVGELRARHFLPVPVVLALIVAASGALVMVPGLDFGWWTALGGQGNPAFGATDRTEGTWLFYAIPLVFIALLLPSLPMFVHREEELFRLGAEDWPASKRIWKGVVFGLVHAVVGIPVGVALALSIGGWYFTAAYLRGYRQGGRVAGLRESTRAHLAYNLTIVAIVAVVFALAASGVGV